MTMEMSSADPGSCAKMPREQAETSTRPPSETPTEAGAELPELLDSGSDGVEGVGNLACSEEQEMPQLNLLEANHPHSAPADQKEDQEDAEEEEEDLFCSEGLPFWEEERSPSASSRARKNDYPQPLSRSPSPDVQSERSWANSPIRSQGHNCQSTTTTEVAAERPRRKGGQVLFNLSHSDYEVVAQVAEDRGWRVVKSEEKAAVCNVHWIDDANIGDWLRKVEPWMRINHFPGMNNALARKTRLARNMARIQRMFPAAYKFVPPTWVIPDDFPDLEKRFGDNPESKVFYIVKPDHLCQGRGIFLTTELERLRQASDDSRKKNEATVVQRYLSRPMLIEGLKFDLRLYFLIAAKKASGESGLDLRCFLFRDGLVRLCTTPYQPPTAETRNEKCMHLTNYAVNKNSENFQQNDGEDDGAGSKRSLRWFMSYVGETFGEKERRKLWLKLMGLCMKTVLMVKPTLETEYDGAFPRDLTGGQMGCRCFELLGIDVMLDAKMKPYLIEVNHLPSFTCDSPLDEDIKQRLVKQTLDLTCGSLSSKDKKMYEQLVRERKEVGQATSEVPRTNWEVDTSMLDLPVYKDFERAWPPPEGASKLREQLLTIESRVRDVFKPLHLSKKKDLAQDDKPSYSERPPRPPARGSAAAPGASRQPAPPPRSSKRSRSAPGPPRCAFVLPPMRKNSPTGEVAPTAKNRSSSARPTRAFLPMKNVQLLI